MQWKGRVVEERRILLLGAPGSTAMNTAGVTLRWRTDSTHPWTVGVDLGTSRTCISLCRAPSPDDLPRDLEILTLPPRDAYARDPKTKTAILLRQRPNFEVVAFGFEAETLYAASLEDGEALPQQEAAEQGGEEQGLLLFVEFKMALAPGSANRRAASQASFESVMVKAQCGTEVPLLVVMVKALEHVRDTGLEEIGKRTPLTVLTADSLQWTLTVPAGWDDYAKAFLRRAALLAGLIRDEASRSLTFCYEPEGAFLGTIKDEPQLLSPLGARVMVVDAGGGTVDVSVHEVRSLQPLELPQVVEREMSSMLGSTAIDRRFEHWVLRELLALDAAGEERVQQSVQWRQDVMRQFERHKISYNDAKIETFSLKLRDLVEAQLLSLDPNFNLSERVCRYSRASGEAVRATAHRLTLPRSVMKTLFDPVVRDVADMVRAAHERAGGAKVCQRVLMAGGFGESRLLIDQVRRALPGVEVLAGMRPSIAIVRGAVVHALSHSVPMRVMAKTVCLQVEREYEEGNAEHEAAIARQASEVVNGKRYVRLFRPLASRGETVAVPTCSVRQGPYWPLSDTQTEARFRFVVTDVAAEGGEAAAADAAGETLAGSVVVPLDMDRPSKDDRAFYVTLEFGDTELRALISDRLDGMVRKHLRISYE